MPCNDKEELQQIATRDLPQVAGAIRAAQQAVADTSHDWGAPFAESAPGGWLRLYEKTGPEWVKSRTALQKILTDAAANVDRSAQGIVTIRTNYMRAEDEGAARMQGILQRLGHG
ncbi:hypothetical protein [Flindersiella endophytica]